MNYSSANIQGWQSFSFTWATFLNCHEGFIPVKMVFGDGESLTPAYKKSDRQTLPECGMVWLSRFRSVLNVWQVSWTAVSNARFLSCFKMP